MKNFSYETRISVWMNKYHFRFDKSLGQNFLIDEAILDRIVAGASPDPEDKVLEIGPGMGFLTEKLSAAFGDVTSVELDASLCRILEDIFAENDKVRIVEGDALKLSMSELADAPARRGFVRPFKIVANLPYYITTPLLFSFLEQKDAWEEMVIMVQKEVAERIVASPGGKDYGVLTLMTAYDADAEILFTVPAASFYPRPNVDSAVLCLKKRVCPPFEVKDRRIFRRFVKAGFAQRRKTLSNALKNSDLFEKKEDVSLLLAQCGIDGKRRGETLSFEEYAALANAYFYFNEA